MCSTPSSWTRNGFIRAEVIAYNDFIQFKGEAGAKEAGKWRLEGKEYIVKDGEDVVMSSQPFQSSPSAPSLATEDDTPILSITLVREEDLEEARKSYESIVSIHVYSLGATKVKDLQILSDANREVLEKYAGQNGAEFGTITNKNLRKRNVSGPRLVPKDAPIPTTKPKAVSELGFRSAFGRRD